MVKRRIYIYILNTTDIHTHTRTHTHTYIYISQYGFKRLRLWRNEGSLAAVDGVLEYLRPLRITGPWWRESTGNRYVPITKGRLCRASMLPLLLAWASCWTNSKVNLRPQHSNVRSLQCGYCFMWISAFNGGTVDNKSYMAILSIIHVIRCQDFV